MAVIVASFSVFANACARARPAADKRVSDAATPLIPARSACRTRKMICGCAAESIASKQKANPHSSRTFIEVRKVISTVRAPAERFVARAQDGNIICGIILIT
jgi:hypothetical protein